MKKKTTVSEFEKWSRFASAIRDMALRERLNLINIMWIFENKKPRW